MIEEMDDTAVEERNEERLLALEIMDGRKCVNTKKQHRRKIEHFTKWVETKHPTCLNEDGSVKLSVISKAIMNEFLATFARKRTSMGYIWNPWYFTHFNMSVVTSQLYRTTTQIWKSI
jgi:hypothetical protein